jgi:hypothetical protein
MGGHKSFERCISYSFGEANGGAGRKAIILTWFSVPIWRGLPLCLLLFCLSLAPVQMPLGSLMPLQQGCASVTSHCLEITSSHIHMNCPLASSTSLLLNHLTTEDFPDYLLKQHLLLLLLLFFELFSVGCLKYLFVYCLSHTQTNIKWVLWEERFIRIVLSHWLDLVIRE